MKVQINNNIKHKTMKRIFTWAVLCLFVFAACGPKEPEYPEPEKGQTYLLQGRVNSDGFTWASNSIVGLYSDTVAVKAQNLQCPIVGYADIRYDEEGNPLPYTPSQYEGQKVARFTTPEMDLIKGKNKFMVYYPWSKDLVYTAGVIYGLEIPSEQTQPAANVAGDCFYYGTAEGIAVVDEFFGFSMNPVSALLKVNISSTELAGYELNRVTIYDDKGEAALGGGFNINVKTGAIKVLKTYSTIATTIRKPAVLQPGESQAVYLNALPGDFTGKDIWVVIEMSGDKGVVTLPIKRNDFKFEAGATTEISLNNLKASDCSVAWYCPVENRHLTGGRYAYGEANCFFIQCKNGQTYTGASYQPNAAYPESVTIDYRPRGDFSKVEDPAGCTFEWARLGALADGQVNGSGAIYTPRVTGYESSAVDPTAFEIIQNEAAYTVTVRNTGAFAGAPVLLMIKNGKILWAFSFWNIAADGTKVEGIPVSGTSVELANIDLGTSSSQYDNWIANKSGTNPDPVFRTTYFYLWGRPTPTFWTTYWTIRWKGVDGNCPGLVGPMSLEQSLANPLGQVFAEQLNTDMPNWLDMPEGQEIGDLWGNCTKDSTTVGRKTIYDPCPKGWRVADAAAYVAIGEACKDGATGFRYEDTSGKVGTYIDAAGGNLFIAQGYASGKTATNGRIATMGGAAAPTKSGCKYGLLWSNWIGSPEKVMPITLAYGSSDRGCTTPVPKVAIMNRSVSAAVRCQVDKENR